MKEDNQETEESPLTSIADIIFCDLRSRLRPSCTFHFVIRQSTRWSLDSNFSCSGALFNLQDRVARQSVRHLIESESWSTCVQSYHILIAPHWLARNETIGHFTVQIVVRFAARQWAMEATIYPRGRWRASTMAASGTSRQGRLPPPLFWGPLSARRLNYIKLYDRRFRGLRSHSHSVIISRHHDVQIYIVEMLFLFFYHRT